MTATVGWVLCAMEGDVVRSGLSGHLLLICSCTPCNTTTLLEMHALAWSC